MPPKRNRAPANSRNGEAQRFLRDGALPSPAAVLARRPHHIVSRLYPPWGSSSNGVGLRTSGVTLNITATTNKAGVSRSVAPALATMDDSASAEEIDETALAHRGQGRIGLPTRVSGKDRGRAVLASAAASSGKVEGCRTSTARKRPRSTVSTSFAVPAEAKERVEDDSDDAEDGDGRGVDAFRNSIDEAQRAETGQCASEVPVEVTQLSSSSPSRSFSLSCFPSRMVTERKMLGGRGGAMRGACADSHGAIAAVEGTPHATGWQGNCLSEAQATTISASETTAAEEILLSPCRLSDAMAPQKPPPHDTAISTADSKVLFLEDGVVGSADGDRQAWLPNDPNIPSNDPGRPARAYGGTNVLGELSENCSITSARPQGLRHSLDRSGGDEDHVPQAGCALTGSVKRLRGEPLDIRCTDTASISGDRVVLGDGDEDKETGRQTSISSTTSSLKRTRVDAGGGSAAPLLEGRALGSAGVTAMFAETLAVQDLSLLRDESPDGAAAVVGGLANGDGCERTPLLSSSTGQHTPCSLIVSAAASGQLRDDTPRAAAAEEALLGEGLVSPPAKRITATPQQVFRDFEATTEDRGENCSGAARGGAGSSRVQTKVSVMGDPSPWRTSMFTPSSATPYIVTGCGEARSRGHSREMLPSLSLVDAAASVTAGQPAPPQVSLTPSSPSPQFSSFPSTLDDGVSKDPSRASQADFVGADAVTPGDCLRSLRLESRGNPAPLALSIAVAQQETVPIDPFLCTPPQFKLESSVRAKNASDGCSTLSRHSPPCSNRAGASKGGNSPAASGSLSRSPSYSAEQSVTGEASTITGADVGVEVLRVGTRVEGRWGRQWFPAVISEAPRNGFVQIEWEEDGSLLHVRLREVRLLPGAIDPKRAGAEPVSHVRIENIAPADWAATTEDESNVLTATQLVALMEEEDAEDSRHEPEASHIRSFPVRGEALPPVTTSAGTQMDRCRGEGGGGTGGDAAARVLCVGHACGAAGCAADTGSAVGGAHWDRGNGVGPSACAADSQSPSRSPVPTSKAQSLPPGEAYPSSLCIFLPHTVRRAILQGEGTPPALPSSSSSSFRYRAGPATELQRRTELQRILHFLASAGAAVVDSLAQADHMAAQIGDNGEVSAIPFACQRPLLVAEQLHSAVSPPMHGAGTASAVSGSGGKRKTVGRVPLPRRSAVSTTVLACEAQRLLPKHFIFLVSSATAIMSGGAEASEKLHQKHDVLPDVCLAHALGVSAIHASWLWSIVPGMARVRLPTPADQVELLPNALQEKSRAWRVASPHAFSTKELQLPLRFAPLPVKDRWLSTKDVAFVVRDDQMETWLNAAGATVTAEPVPSSPSHVTRQSLSRDTSRLSAAAASAPAGRSLGSILPRRRSASSSRSPLLKQPRAERTPDFVYVPSDATVPLDLDRLGSVPVLSVSWLADGIEQHYRHSCSSTLTAGPGLPTPPSLASVWAATPPTKPPKESHAKCSDTSSHPNHAHLSPSSPSLQPAATDAKRCIGSEGVQETKTAAASVHGNERECRRQHGSDAVHAELVPQSAECGKDSADAAAPSAALLSTSDVNADEDVRDAIGMRRGFVSEEEAVTKRISGGTTKEKVNSEAEEDIIPRLADTTGAAATVVPNTSAPTELSVCASHPAIALGEDYYFTMSAPPPPAPPPLPPSPPPHRPSLLHSPYLVLPATTIVLGRVVDWQVDAPPTPLLRQQLWAKGAVSSFTLSQPHCQCRVTLQLYEPKYISMHVDPRSGEVVRQTTVCLSRRWATVPGTSLLYDTPVYVITTAARPHVYLLEEEDEVTVPGMSDGTYHSRLLSQPVLGAASTPPASDLSQGAFRTMPDGIPPSEFHGRGSRGALAPSMASERTAQGSSGGDVNERHQCNWALHATEKMSMSPTCDAPIPSARSGSAQRAGHQPTPKRQAGAVAPEPQKVTRAAVLDRHELASLPLTLSSTELDCSPPSVAVAGGNGTFPALEAHPARQFQQQTMTLGNSPRTVRLLAELPLQLGDNEVVLRPNSHISFYPRSSLSLSRRLSGRRPLVPARDGRPHMHVGNGEDRRVARQPIFMNAAGLAARSTGEPVHRTDNGNDSAGCDVASDTSEEIILEAPLIGQVELLREVEGRIDIVVHTSQPNSVFGGSKMFRITPDMIVYASP